MLTCSAICAEGAGIPAVASISASDEIVRQYSASKAGASTADGMNLFEISITASYCEPEFRNRANRRSENAKKSFSLIPSASTPRSVARCALTTAETPFSKPVRSMALRNGSRALSSAALLDVATFTWLPTFSLRVGRCRGNQIRSPDRSDHNSLDWGTSGLASVYIINIIEHPTGGRSWHFPDPRAVPSGLEGGNIPPLPLNACGLAPAALTQLELLAARSRSELFLILDKSGGLAKMSNRCRPSRRLRKAFPVLTAGSGPAPAC